MTRLDGISKKELTMLYSVMLRIRMIEERLAGLYPSGKMRTPVHFSIGQEAVSAGVCTMLNNKDMVFASHRSHAAYFAKGGSLKEMMAELYGRLNGCCRGKGGSQHLSSFEKNMYSAPILGEMIAVAVGAGLAFSLDKAKQVSVVFFGDAALEEGIFAESVNFAVIKKLPVLFVCENNFYSTHTHIRFRQPDIPIYKRVRAMGIASRQIDGNNILQVCSAGKDAIKLCRQAKGPFFLECITYRYREHVGPNYDFNNPYRTREDVACWMKRCPIKKLQKILVRDGIFTLRGINSLKEKINYEIDRAIEYAENSPWPIKRNLTLDVY